jgi:hypothetical protein
VPLFHFESLEAQVCSCFTDADGQIRPNHRKPEYEPGIVSLPRIGVLLPELRHWADHVPGDNVKLQSESLGLILLHIMVEPETAFIGTQSQAQTMYIAHPATS